MSRRGKGLAVLASPGLIALIVMLAVLPVQPVPAVSRKQAASTATPGVPPEVQGLPPDKQTVVAIDTVERATALAYPTRAPWVTLVIPTLTAVWVPVDPNAVQPPKISGYIPGNAWSTEVDGVAVMIFAGEKGDLSARTPAPERAQGMLILEVFGRSVDTYFYRAPQPRGRLAVVGQHLATLILRSTDGTTFYFDLRSRQFVASLDTTPVPVTPSPYPAPP